MTMRDSEPSSILPRWLIYAGLVVLFFAILRFVLPLVWRFVYDAGLLVAAAVLAAVVLAILRRR